LNLNNNNNNNKRERLRSIKATSVFGGLIEIYGDMHKQGVINKKAWFDHFPCNAQRTVVDDCLCLSISFDKVVSLSYQS
jgi:hypothetical protein